MSFTSTTPEEDSYNVEALETLNLEKGQEMREERGLNTLTRMEGMLMERGRKGRRASGSAGQRPADAGTCFDLTQEVMGRYFIPNWGRGNRQLEHVAGLESGIETAKLIYLLRE